MITLLVVAAAVLLSSGSVNTSLLAQESTGASAAPTSAEREAIWNSPAMLRARAWVQEYCERSAKISPAEGKQYMAELAALSPAQMKLWLLKFDEEHEQQQQNQSAWRQAHQAALSQAMAADKAAQSSLAAVSEGENAAAKQEQGELNTLQAQANEAAQQKRSETAADAGLWGPGYLGGAYGPGGYNVHFHLYPY